MKQVSGLLNQKVKIYKFVDADDGAGGSIGQKVLYWETSAKVEELKSSRALEANQEKLKPVFVFEVRYRTDKFVIADMQIEWRGVNFTINKAEQDYVYRERLKITAIANSTPQR